MKICKMSLYILRPRALQEHYTTLFDDFRSVVRSSERTVASHQVFRRRVSLSACVVRVWTRAHEHLLPRALNCTPGNTRGNVGIDGIQLTKSENTSGHNTRHAGTGMHSTSTDTPIPRKLQETYSVSRQKPEHQ